MIELWSKEQIRAKLPDGDQAIKDMIDELYQTRSAGIELTSYIFRDYRVLKFTHVFEEYNEVVLDVLGTSLIVQIRDAMTGLTIEQVFRKDRQVTITDYVTAREL
jgi:hypothetical protein